MHRECGRMALVKQNADINTPTPGKAVAIANGAYRIESHYEVLRDEGACTYMWILMNTTDYEYVSTLSVPQGCSVDHPGERHILHIWNSSQPCVHLARSILEMSLWWLCANTPNAPGRHLTQSRLETALRIPPIQKQWGRKPSWAVKRMATKSRLLEMPRSSLAAPTESIDTDK